MLLIMGTVCASPQGLYSNLLEHCCYYLHRDMCNLFHFLLQVYVYLKKNGQRYYYLIVLYYFILLTEIELFMYREKIRALKVVLYLLFIYVKDVSSCGIG